MSGGRPEMKEQPPVQVGPNEQDSTFGNRVREVKKGIMEAFEMELDDNE